MEVLILCFSFLNNDSFYFKIDILLLFHKLKITKLYDKITAFMNKVTVKV